jgi:hypothetical protein
VILINPNTGKPVDVAAEFIDRLIRAGFRKPEDVPKPKTGRRRKASK